MLAAVAQICSSRSVSKNLVTCQKVIQEAAKAGAKLICLPEASDFLGTTGDETSKLAASKEVQDFIKGIQDSARLFRVWISIGVHEPAKVRALPTKFKMLKL